MKDEQRSELHHGRRPTMKRSLEESRVLSSSRHGYSNEAIPTTSHPHPRILKQLNPIGPIAFCALGPRDVTHTGSYAGFHPRPR